MSATADVTVTNPSGLHARPAAQFVEAARGFDADIKIRKDGKEGSAKSLIGVLKLGITAGTAITLVAEGADEEQAVEQLGEFLRTLKEDE